MRCSQQALAAFGSWASTMIESQDGAHLAFASALHRLLESARPCDADQVERIGDERVCSEFK